MYITGDLFLGVGCLGFVLYVWHNAVSFFLFSSSSPYLNGAQCKGLLEAFFFQYSDCRRA